MALVLRYSPSEVPLAVLAAAKVSKVEFTAVADENLAKDAPPLLNFPNGEELLGAATLLRYFGRAGQAEGLYGSTALLASQVDEWIEYAPILANGAEFERTCAYIDAYLSVRTFLVGYDLSIADVAVWTGLAATGPRWESLRKAASPKYPNLVRWYNTTLASTPQLGGVLASWAGGRRGEAAARGGGAKGKEAAEKGGGRGGEKKGGAGGERSSEGPAEIDLPEAVEGQVVTRFPPEPSGYLHIGHAKAALMNQFFADKYKGRLIIRFDDTNPTKEKDEFVESILADLETLGVRGERITYTSDYFDELQEMAVRLIQEGKAYVDDTPQEAMRTERLKGVESKNRGNSVERNLALWGEMVAGSAVGVQCCLRGKLDMGSPNGTMRDPVYYRCNPTPHHRVGSRYKVYPTYDFACPYVDSVEGVTHALRSSEYHDRNEQYMRVLEDMGVRKVHLYDFSRLNFQYTLLSKRKLAWFVEAGRVDGWGDPRFPTVQGIMRRGLTVEALKLFILSQGASKNLNLMEWDKLWTMNKKIIDPVCPRHTAVLTEGRVLLTLTDGPAQPFVRIVPRHKKFEGAGSKATTFTRRVWMDQADAAAVKEGEEVTLMDWGNAIVQKVERGEGGVVRGLEGVLHLEGSVKSTKLKLTWLAEMDELVALTLVELDYLILKKKLEEEDDFTAVLNPKTRWEIPAIGDANLRNLKKGDILQLERKGYYICDVPYVRPSKPMVLIAIPDGRQRPPPGETGLK